MGDAPATPTLSSPAAVAGHSSLRSFGLIRKSLYLKEQEQNGQLRRARSASLEPCPGSSMLDTAVVGAEPGQELWETVMLRGPQHSRYSLPRGDGGFRIAGDGIVTSKVQ